MKRYITFIVSFILLFLLFQVMSGMLLTLAYTPDVEEAWNATANLAQVTVIKSSYHPFLLMFLPAILSASLAYFISNKISSNKGVN